MFYIKSISLSNRKGHDYYYCMDDSLESIKKKFVALMKKGVTDIVIISDEKKYIF